jgi:putative flippase GtrA
MAPLCMRPVLAFLSDRPGLAVLLRFGLVGVLNTAFGYAAFALLVQAGAGVMVALVLAMLAGVAFNFQTARRLVFRSGGSAVRFVAAYGGILALNWLLLQALMRAGLHELPGQALLALPVAAGSFVVQKLFVFAPERERG